jgi:hypothetical protein
MGRTLLIGHSGVSWRGWLKEHRGERDLIVLDPAEPGQSPPGRLCAFHGDRPVWSRFYGSLDPQRFPHVMVAATADLLDRVGDDALVLLFPYRPGPLLRHLTALISHLVRPEEILLAAGTPIEQGGFSVGPQEVELEEAFPPMVQSAQRKAQWLKLFESCTEQEVRLDGVAIEGARLGAGTPVPVEDLRRAGLGEVSRGELSGATLTLVAEKEPEENVLAGALDTFHASRAHTIAPADFENLLCSFADGRGEDFGIGLVDCVDFAMGVARIRSTAVPPAPVRILRLGALRVDPSGNELAELRPWQV